MHGKAIGSTRGSTRGNTRGGARGGTHGTTLNITPNTARPPTRSGASGAPGGFARPAAEALPAAVQDLAQQPGWREVIERTVQGLGYEVVDVERAPRGLLQVFIDRVPGRVYATGPSESVTVEDCEQVTRQLRYALEVDAVDYARLEVSSPGLDRPLRRPADYARFAGLTVSLTLKIPFQGRKSYKGVLGSADPVAGQDRWALVFSDGKGEQVLAFALNEVREARLVPVLDFKGRHGRPVDVEPAATGPEVDGGKDR